ncbi:hypothetical protein OIU76_027737, partial [Salix suchowensis]
MGNLGRPVKSNLVDRGKQGVAVGIESVDNGLMASGNMTVDSSLVEAVGNVSGGSGLKDLSMGSAGLDGKPIEVAPRTSTAAVLGPSARAAQKVFWVLIRVRECAVDELQNLKGFGQGGHKGKALQSKSYISRGH